LSAAPTLTPEVGAAVDETVAYLASDEAAASIARNLYWPKWDSPWWRMSLLHELGLGDRIPARAARLMAEALNGQCLRFFPLRPEDVPAGVDSELNAACHCQVGNGARFLHAAGIDVEAEIPWVRDWLLRYQLPDGGLNCDERVYLRPVPRSSFCSTLPAAEAVLDAFAAGRPPTREEAAFLDRAAGYLLARRLAFSLSKGGAVADPVFLEPCFPRFYEYDVLRGLRFLARYAARTGKTLPPDALTEAVSIADRLVGHGSPPWAPRRFHETQPTRRQDASGAWYRAPRAGTFPLLDLAAGPLGAEALRREWAETRARLGLG